MKSIKEELNVEEVPKLTNEEIVEMQCEWENENVGDLNIKDGYNCDLCKNKGWIYVVEDNKRSYYAKPCKCTPIRRTINRLNNCGITKTTLEHNTFDNFVVEEEWQNRFKSVFLYARNEILNNGRRIWLCASGQSGCGKTHLCTSLFQDLIESGLDGEYILWNDFLPKVMALQKSSFTDNQEKYEAILKRIREVDVLYIDDLFKLADNKKQELSMVYNVINARYLDDNKVTIISTEYSQEEIQSMDSAICGRIRDKCDCGKTWIKLKYEDGRNYRMKNREEI